MNEKASAVFLTSFLHFFSQNLYIIDMDVLQPLLFSLQATQEEIPVLLPQLLQYPFFKPNHATSHSDGWPASLSADHLLHCGHIRLGVSIDKEIYQLLKFHCCKGPGARQAEALIETACRTSYVLPNCNELLRLYDTLQNMPPLLSFDSGQMSTVEESIDESDVVFMSDSPVQFPQVDDSCLSTSPEMTSRSSSISKFQRSSVELETADTSSSMDRESGIYPPPSRNIMRTYSFKARKNSIYDPHPPFVKRVSTDSDSSVASTSMSASDRHWHCSLPFPRDMIVGMYGDTTYPVLTWSEDLRVTFQMGTIGSGMRSTNIEIEPLQRTLKLRVQNNSQKRIAISVRAHRQSMPFKPHIIHPSEGLHMMETRAIWEKDFEVVRKVDSRDEHIAIDLLVCVFDEQESMWNIQRRYAVVKSSKE